jgi:hypothetical protein
VYTAAAAKANPRKYLIGSPFWKNGGPFREMDILPTRNHGKPIAPGVNPGAFSRRRPLRLKDVGKTGWVFVVKGVRISYNTFVP